MAKAWIEYVVISILIAIVWILLSLPIIFYHLPLAALHTSLDVDSPSPNSSNTSTSKPTANNSCSSPVSYTGSVCSDVLQQYTDCLPGNTHGSAIMTTQNRSSLEEKVSRHIELVKLFARTEECREAAVPMLCLYYLGPLCDSERRSHRLSREQCLHLSEKVCKSEWAVAGSYTELPNCNSHLFTEKMQLSASCSQSNSSQHTSKKLDINSTVTCSLNCSEKFFCQPGMQSCTPSCDWTEYHEPINTIINVCVILSASLGVLFGILTLISAIIRRQRMCTFPSVIVVYQTIAALIIALLVLIGVTNQKALFCQGNDLIANTRHSTPFCILTATVSHYLLLNLSLWWICHTAVIYWKLQFPFQARNFEIEKKIKYIHIGCLLFCTLASFVPIAVIMLVNWRQRVGGENMLGTLGFGITRFPPIMCTGVNRYSVYYSLILPINLLVPVGVTLLILVIWLIHKHSQVREVTDSKHKRCLQMTSAQAKVLFVLCYYVIVTLVSLTGLTIVSRDGPGFAKELIRYFACERQGYNPEHPCDTSQLEKSQHPGLVAISFIFVGLFPMINFIFTTSFTELRDALVKCYHYRQQPVADEKKSLMGKGSVKSQLKKSDDEYSTDHD